MSDEVPVWFSNMRSVLEEHCADYLVFARADKEDGCFIFSGSDRTWGMGVCNRYVNFMNEKDKSNMRRENNEY